MSIAASKAVWQHSEAAGSARLVMLCIADHYNDDKGTAWPSIATIAAETKVSARQVSRAIAGLVELGELQIEEKGNGRGYSSVYRIMLPITTGKDDMVSSFPVVIKDDTMSQKGDISSQKDDTMSVKDDTMSPEPLEPLIEPSGNRESDPPPVHTSSTAADFQDLLAEMEAALATVCKKNLAFGRHKAQLEPIAINLAHLGISPGEVKEGFGPGGWWYLFSHGAKNGSAPYPGNIESDIVRVQEWIKAGKPMPSQKSNGHHPPGKDATTELLLARLRAAESE